MAAVAAGLGCLAAAFALAVGIRDGDFRVHVVQHLLIAMAAPLLLALSAPVTLALRVASRPVRARLLRALRPPGPHRRHTGRGAGGGGGGGQP